eukprot:330594-Chlamydomonas_euryale.AAC.3
MSIAPILEAGRRPGIVMQVWTRVDTVCGTVCAAGSPDYAGVGYTIGYHIIGLKPNLIKRVVVL